MPSTQVLFETKKARALGSGDRFCNVCTVTKTGKWYRDHQETGHLCKKCYNQRYKERR